MQGFPDEFDAVVEVSCSLPMPNSDSLNQKSARDASPLSGSRKRHWPRILLWSAAMLLAVLLIAAGVGVILLRSAAKAALPVLDGDLAACAGLSAPVTVRRDAHGVPHIEAANQDDLFVAQGYVTAQDRLWQMDAFRRNANGELAEILGPSLVQHDRTQRVLQFRNTARRIYANLPAADRVRLDDYARGVNLFIAQHHDSLPPEFKLLFYRPQPWSGVDSVSIGADDGAKCWIRIGMRSSRASGLRPSCTTRSSRPIFIRLARGAIVRPPAAVIDWSQPHPAPPGNRMMTTKTTAPRPAPRQPTDEDLDAQLLTLLGLTDVRTAALLDRTTGSSPGSHTASGKPLLSNDMHLGLTEPNIWYHGRPAARPAFTPPESRCPACRL